ncbi:MAG: stage III sporulation protein AF [Clostridiales bacterium]|jgi:stage III sporulation protein AF|nr:stage III sporulation protein AF [Clostridiales bacterium]
MIAWIISVAGVSVLTVLLDIILPEGQMNKYVKGVLSVVVTVVIISPAAGLLKDGLDFERLFGFARNVYAVDQNYVYAVYADAYGAEEARMKSLLSGAGIKIESADIVFDPANKRKILYVNIFLRQSVIDGDSAHINISDGIKKLISEKYALNRNDVRVLII